MQSKKPHFTYIILFSILLSGLVFSTVNAAIDPPGVLDPAHKSALKELKFKADNQAIQNLNRYAIDHLINYSNLLDSFNTVEIRDSILQLENEYKISTGGRTDELAKNKLLIQELTDAKAANLDRYNALLRKAGIAFAAWFLIVFVLLQIRKRNLRKQDKKLNNNITKLHASMQRAEQGKKLLALCKACLTHYVELERLAKQLADNIKIKQKEIRADEKLNKLIDQTSSLADKTQSEINISKFISLLEKEPGNETELVDINPICESALEVAMRGNSLNIPADVLVVSKDLEKKLPQIPIVPEAIHALLLNILNNSFQAIKIKYDEGIKGYQPKVILSTRILPRFLQIRIRDNGDGIPTDQLEKVQEEFYSLRPLEIGAGLGLSDSQKLIGEPHKGDLRIETDLTEGTNVYIKFYL